MKNHRWALLCLVCTMFVWGCKKEADTPAFTPLEVLPLEREVSASTGRFTITIRGGGGWTASVLRDSWLVWDRVNDSILAVSYQSNPLTTAREARLRITLREESKEVTISQAAGSGEVPPLPADLLEFIGEDNLTVLNPLILIAKRGPYRSRLTRAHIVQFFRGHGLGSLAPMLLQMGITTTSSALRIHYVDIPMGYTVDDFRQESAGINQNCSRNLLFDLTDEAGEFLSEQISVHCKQYRILFATEFPGVFSPGGLAGAGFVLTNRVGETVYRFGRWAIINDSFNDAASLSVIAHEIGHTFGLRHTNTAQACMQSSAPTFLMASVLSVKEAVFLQPCEAQITTSRFAGVLERGGYKPLLNFDGARNNVRRVSIGGDAINAIDIVNAWRFLDETGNPSGFSAYTSSIDGRLGNTPVAFYSSAACLDLFFCAYVLHDLLS